MNGRSRPRGAAPESARTETSEAWGASQDLLAVIHAAWLVGYDHGLAEGRASERATIDWELRAKRGQHLAVLICESPERDHEADRAAAERREAWWAARRGETPA